VDWLVMHQANQRILDAAAQVRACGACNPVCGEHSLTALGWSTIRLGRTR
jgi:hypothetical protein